MHWLAQAPANIALIKYMGKKDSSSNVPDNSSLSYTLDHLVSTVHLECHTLERDCWQPLLHEGCSSHFNLSLAGQERFIKHLQRLKEYFGYEGSFLIQSNNNFPHGSGLASSASSFAALTLCAARALSDLTGKMLPSITTQAQLSRLGSGSSCRSFFTPWALWHDETVEELILPYKKLIHQVLVISDKEKSVSSSEAHARVKTSSAYAVRPERAEQRLTQLIAALHAQNWPLIYSLCWDDFQDMHHLFSHCEQPFSYISQQSRDALALLQGLWDKNGDGPIVTMDAGPNIHLLYREDQLDLAQQIQTDHLDGIYHVL